MKRNCRIATVLLILLLTLLMGGVASAQAPPTVTTNAASGVTTDSATLNGNLTSLGNASSVDVSFEWGLTISYGNETTPQTMTATGAFSDSISGLDPGTTYHFRAKAVGNGTAYGGDVTFTTSTTPPAVTTNAASGVTINSATLNGSLTSLGTAGSVDVSFEWGLTISYGNETTPQTMTATGAFSDSISGLDPGTTYHFRAKAVGDGTAYGGDATFTTGTTPPTVTTNAASGVTTDSATLNGSLTSLGTAGSVDVSFEWGLTISYGNETTPQTMTATGAFSDSISGLDPNTTYHFRAKAAGDGTAFGSDMTFTTSTAPTVTTSAASGVTANSATLNGVLTSLGNASSVDVSFEWGLTTGYGSETTPQTMTATGAFSDSISGLDPGTTYHFRVKAVFNDTVFGDDVTFETAEWIELEGWGWCTDYGQIVDATLEGYAIMVERSHASQSFSLHVVGNLTLQLPGADEVVPLDMYGSRVRSLFYLRQEITGKSVSLTGTWMDAGGGQYYIITDGAIALPNPEGEALKTARVCFLVLRTPEVEVPIQGLGSFAEDIEAMLSRFIKFIDNLLDSLIGTGIKETLGNILIKIATLLAALRELGVPYIP